MKVLDLFSGIGGFSLGLERAGMETVAFCEIEEFPRKVLAKHWPGIRIHKDIRKLDGTQYRGTVDVVCGGFPCQPYSQAGERRGEEDDRALWPEMYRVVREVEPAWIIGENVDGFRTMGLDACISDLEDSGYACQTFDIPACGVGACHIRHRLWIVAHADRAELRNESGWRGRANRQDTPELADDGQAGVSADSEKLQRSEIIGRQQNGIGERGEGGGIYGNANGDSKPVEPVDGEASRLQDVGNTAEPQLYQAGCWDDRTRRSPLRPGGTSWRITEPPVCGADDVVPRRVDRLRSLGNSVVPAIPELIGRAIKEVSVYGGNQRAAALAAPRGR